MGKVKQGVTGDSDMQPLPMTEEEYKAMCYERYNCIDERSGVIDQDTVEWMNAPMGFTIPLRAKTITKAEYYAFVEQTFARMLVLIKRKNADYCGTTDDPFANFRRAEQVKVDPINGLAVRFLDKVARIESFFQAGKLENESFEDAWLDVIGYACLALGMLNEKHRKQ